MSCARGVTLLLAAAPTAAGAQHLGGAGSPDVSLVRVMLALAVCLLVAALAVFLIRQRISGRPPALLFRFKSSAARIRVVESRRVGMQAELCIAQCDGEEYLLLLSQGGPLLLRQGAVPASLDEVA